MVFTAYMLLFEDGYLYTGSTCNLFKRTREHYLLGGHPKVIWKQRFPTRAEAAAREKQLKGWTRAKKLALAEGKYDELKLLSKRRAGRPLPPPTTVRRVYPEEPAAA